jgi:hypothetical protein
VSVGVGDAQQIVFIVVAVERVVVGRVGDLVCFLDSERLVGVSRTAGLLHDGFIHFVNTSSILRISLYAQRNPPMSDRVASRP